MKIKIPPHADPIITEESLAKISPSELANNDNSNHNKSNNFIVIAKHEGEKERVYQMLGIKHDEKQFISVLPSPTHLFLTSSLEFLRFRKKLNQMNLSDLANVVMIQTYLSWILATVVQIRVTQVILRQLLVVL